MGNQYGFPAASASAAVPTFQVNGTNLTSDSTINFENGSNVTITNPTAGNVEIAASGGGGGTVTAVTGVTPVSSSGGTTPAISVATATTGNLGVVQPDGTTIAISGGVISAVGSGGAITQIGKAVVGGTSTGVCSVGSGNTSISATAIPGTYSTLIITVAGQSAAATGNFDTVDAQFNGDVGTDYSTLGFYMQGSSTLNGFNGTGTSLPVGVIRTHNSDLGGGSTGFIVGYSGTNFTKSVTMTGSCDFWYNAGSNWNSSAAITSIKFFLGSGLAFEAGTVLTIYAMQ